MLAPLRIKVNFGDRQAAQLGGLRKGVLCGAITSLKFTMPPKKRDKDGETSKSQRSEAAKTDHDLFLQAFESEY